MSVFELLAMAAPTPAGTDANPTGSMVQMLGMFAILGVMFYFLLIRPQSKQRKEHDNLLKNLKAGDKVLTSAGIYGVVANVKDKSILVKIADNVKVEMSKSSITTVLEAGSSEATEK